MRSRSVDFKAYFNIRFSSSLDVVFGWLSDTYGDADDVMDGKV